MITRIIHLEKINMIRIFLYLSTFAVITLFPLVLNYIGTSITVRALSVIVH